jgi:hypothetical protein
LGDFRFVRSWDLDGDERDQVVDPRTAQAALTSSVQFGWASGTLASMHAAVCRHSPGFAPRAEVVLPEVLEAVLRGELVALKEQPGVPPPPVEEEVKVEPEKESGPAWFEVRVVWDDTGEPVSGVALVIDPGKGSTSMLETDSDGRARVDPVPGACSVRAKADGLAYKECARFVDTGERPPPENASTARRKAPSALAIVELRHGRDGETLESVATAAGLTWKKLAKFNFGTDDQDKVSAHLAADVGCFKRGPDQKKYVFTAVDDPGMLLIPKPLELKLLAPGVHHVLRVAPIELPLRAFLFSA